MRRFQFFTDNCRKVICVTHYMGKPIRGVAKCSPNDTFDFEKGKEIAELRCREKLEKKRMENVEKRYNEICKERKKLERRFAKICSQLTTSNATYHIIKDELEIALENFNTGVS